MKRFVIFYTHHSYGRYSTIIEDYNNITDALDWFINNYNHRGVHGIMEIN